MRKTLPLFIASVLVATSAMAGQREHQAVELLHDIAERISGYAHYTTFDDVSVALEEGVVTLAGKVTTEVKRDEIAKRVANVRGVRELHNQIAILPSSEVDDAIRRRLARSIYGTPVEFDAVRPDRFQALRDDLGIGDYGSSSLRAGGSAWLAGRNHELGESDVWGPIGHWPSSAWTSTAANSFRQDSPFQRPIHIVVEHAHVTLKGIVSDNAERLRLKSLTASTLGVRSVTSELRTEADVRAAMWPDRGSDVASPCSRGGSESQIVTSDTEKPSCGADPTQNVMGDADWEESRCQSTFTAVVGSSSTVPRSSGGASRPSSEHRP